MTAGEHAAREHAVRAMWTLFEPIHAVSYFAPHAREAFADIGLTRYWDGYFAGRAAPLGPVPAAPVVAIFNGFSPFLVGRALPAAWGVASVDEVLDARSRGAAAALRSVVADESLVAEAASALTPVAQRIDVAGRPLAAANRALPEESDPYRQLWRAATILREHRGDGHVTSLLSEGIAGLAAIVLRSAIDIESTTMKRARGWSEAEWDAQADELIARGLLTADRAITPAGSAAIDNAEHLTNRLAQRPWSALDDTGLTGIARLIAPIAHACGTFFPYPNPIGMPQPWNPDDDPDAVAISEVPVKSAR
ncbi:SCO6745 family protein [Rathayibacter soli]|uniref:SCO6745 family protein n=1 Tax=Rathayibacter soli TaxID=3144168 RepID=UPI0027E40FAB|nr:hypothetical protein [Glaciibacter superstes]